MKPMVYIAGPISLGDKKQNALEALELAEQVYDHGIVPVVPHLSVFWESERALDWDYEAWMDIDFNMIARCDAVLRMYGESPGADREVDLAFKLQIPIFYDPEILFDWASRYTSDNGIILSA
jgi:hypothetical protein